MGIAPTYSSIKNKQRVVMPYLHGSLQNSFKYESSLFAATENSDYQGTAGASTATGEVSGRSLGADVSHRYVSDSGSEVTVFASAALRSELLGTSSVTSAFATGPTTFNNIVGGGTGTYGALGLGVTVALNENAKLSVSYGGAYGKSTRLNSLSLNMSSRF